MSVTDSHPTRCGYVNEKKKETFAFEKGKDALTAVLRVLSLSQSLPKTGGELSLISLSGRVMLRVLACESSINGKCAIAIRTAMKKRSRSETEKDNKPSPSNRLSAAVAVIVIRIHLLFSSFHLSTKHLQWRVST